MEHLVEGEVDDDLHEEGVTLHATLGEGCLDVVASAEVARGKFDGDTLGCLPLVGMLANDRLLLGGDGGAVVYFSDVHS